MNVKQLKVHRELQYLKAFYGYMDGALPREYVQERWIKLKEVNKCAR